MCKTWIALVLAIALCLGSGAAKSETVQADQQQLEQLVIPVQCAAKAFDTLSLDGYMSFTISEETGEWSAGADAFEAVLDHAKRSDVGDLLLMQMKWMGNARTSLIQPVLELYYFGTSKLEADAISIRVGNLRYDVLAKFEAIKVGSRSAERIWAPLTEQGTELLDALQQTDAYSLRIHGARTRSADVKRNETGSDTRRKLLSASFECFTMADAIDMEDYRLWDLNAAAWKAAHGFEPCVDVVPLAEQKGFEVLSPGNSGVKVRELQKQLIEHWFLSGSADSTYGERLREAVLRAQKHFGLMQTGSADDRLMDLLSGAASPPVSGQNPEPVWTQLGSVSLRMNRYWCAGAIEPSMPSIDMRQGYSVDNQDNMLVIFDGEIRNDDISSLHLDSQIKGTVFIENIPFGCVFFCERDQNTAFDTQLMPLARTRLIIAAEIPRSLHDVQNVSLLLEHGNKTLRVEGAKP